MRAQDVQDLVAGRGEVVDISGKDIGDPQRNPGRREDRLDITAEVVGLPRKPQTDRLAFPADGLDLHPVGGDDLAVQDEVSQALLLDALAPRFRRAAVTGTADRWQLSNVKRSQRQERRVADRTGGRVTPGSGNGTRKNNDVCSATESWECTTTAAVSFPLKLANLRTAATHAVMDGRWVVFGSEFSSTGDEYVILEQSDYMEMRDRIAALEGGTTAS